MMKGDRLYLEHILDAAMVVQSYTSGVSHAHFLQNRMLQDAITRQLEIIGEASGKLSDEIRDKHDEIEWHQIIGLRNRLIHAYFQVDIELIWEIATTDVPVLKRCIQEILG